MGAHMGHVGPRWAPCWPHEPCNRKIEETDTSRLNIYFVNCSIPCHISNKIICKRATIKSPIGPAEPPPVHYNDVVMGAIASQITSLTIVYSIVYSDADQSKHQSSASLDIVLGIHRATANFHAQMASNAENVSIWLRHHVAQCWLVPELHFRSQRTFWTGWIGYPDLLIKLC